jgi:hypothetical protein
MKQNRKLTRLQLSVLQLCWRGPVSLDGLGIPNGVPRSLKMRGLLTEPGAGAYMITEEGMALVREELQAQNRAKLKPDASKRIG